MSKYDYVYVLVGQGDRIAEIESKFLELLSDGYEIINSIGSGLGAHYILRKKIKQEDGV